MSDLIDRQAAIDAVKKLREDCVKYYEKRPCKGYWELTSAMNVIKILPSVQPEQQSYSCGQENDLISRRTALDAIGNVSDYNNGMVFEALSHAQRNVSLLPSAQLKWNNHTVACLLADLFDDPCACNYNGIDEWLPEKCEVIDACPHPVGVACWEQYLEHRAERREE